MDSTKFGRKYISASFSMYCNLKDYLVTRLNAMLPA
jgi:hypothetical protein